MHGVMTGGLWVCDSRGGTRRFAASFPACFLALPFGMPRTHVDRYFMAVVPESLLCEKDSTLLVYVVFCKWHRRGGQKREFGAAAGLSVYVQ